jgi:hypothetical protein
VSSADAYTLADGTWFQSGHYAAYLGGYDSAIDLLGQVIYVPLGAASANLSFSWYMKSTETINYPFDKLQIRLRDDATGNLITTLYTVTNQSPREAWQAATVDLLGYRGQQGLRLSIEGRTDGSRPTSFFVDDVRLQVCLQSDCGSGEPASTPTPTSTPDPASDSWTFDGEVSDPGTGEPVPCTDATLYHYEGNDWQAVDSASTGSEGEFTLRYVGPSAPGWFLILLRYPSGYVPALPQPGPHFVIAHNQTLMSAGAVPPGVYAGHRFTGLYQPNATPMPGTPTPPPLPTIPIPITLTPLLPTIPPMITPSPTMISPLPTATP